jgi:hypothetical protein
MGLSANDSSSDVKSVTGRPANDPMSGTEIVTGLAAGDLALEAPGSDEKFSP